MHTLETTSGQLADVLYGATEHLDHFAAYQGIVDTAGPKRVAKVRLVASASGLYLFNLVALLEPKHLMVFDDNPAELLLFSMMRRVILKSRTADEWMRRLRDADYPVESDEEAVFQKNLARRATGRRVSGRGEAPLAKSLEFAIESFRALKACLKTAKIRLEHAAVTDPAFKALLARQRNTWIYFGCLHQDLRSDTFEFEYPRNTVLLFANPRKVDDRAILDLDECGESGKTLRIYCKNVRRISNPIWYRDSDDTSGLSVRVSRHPMDRFWYLDTDRATPLYEEIAKIIKGTPYRKIVEVGCRHGRITEFFDKSYKFLGFDIVGPAIKRARLKVAKTKPGCDFTFVEADWDHPPDADADVVVFGGVFHYIKDRLAFFEKYLEKYDPKLVIIADIQATDLSSVNAVYPWTDKRTLHLQIKRRYRVIYTFPIKS